MTSGTSRVCVCCVKALGELAFIRLSMVRKSLALDAAQRLERLEDDLLVQLADLGPKKAYWRPAGFRRTA